MLLPLREVSAKTGCSRSFIIAHVADNTFPAPVKIGPKKQGWLAAEIDEWIRQCAAARPQTRYQVEAA